MAGENESFKMLQQMPVFGGLTDIAIRSILDHSRIVDVAATEYFFHEGETAESFFVLITGSVRIEKNWNGTAVEIRKLAAGDCIGEMAILDLQSRSASVGAEANCQAIEITRSTLHKLYQDDIQQYAIIMMNMGREVSRRIRTASDRLFALDQSQLH